MFFFILVLFVVQFNNCIGLRPELQYLPLTSGETCKAQVQYIALFTPTNTCKLKLEEDECGHWKASYSSQIKDCSGCDCLTGRNIDFWHPNVSVMVPKINPQLVERIKKSNTFEVAGFVVPDSLYYVTISVIGISTFGMLAYTFPLGLILVPLAIAWLLSILLGHSLILGIGPEIERSPEEYAALFVLAFIPAQVMSIFILPLVLLQTPLVIWTLPQKIREFEIEAIEEKVYAFELEDLYE